MDRSDSTRTLEEMLATARAQGAALVRLSAPLEPLNGPAIFGPTTLLQSTRVEAAWLGLRFEDEPACARSAAVEGGNLRVSAAGQPEVRWGRAEAAPVDLFRDSRRPCVELRVDPAAPPSSLLAAANTALENGHWPIVQVPRGRGWPARAH